MKTKKLKAENCEQVKNAAAKGELTEDEYRAIPDSIRNLPTMSETAQNNGYIWQEWLKLSNSDKQSIGRLQATAQKHGLDVKEYMSLERTEEM